MASIALLVFGFFALAYGLYYHHKKIGKITGAVIISVIGLVCLYVGITFTDLVLSFFKFSPGFPPPASGYYFAQAIIYILLGVFILAVHYFLLRDMSSKEISHAFSWTGSVLLISGSIDLFVDTFIRVPSPIIRLGIGILVLAILVFAANRYRDRLFGKQDSPQKAVRQ